jgi:septum site-determining protein MinC
MPTDERVIIKGVRDGLLILLDDKADWRPLLDELDSRLAARRAFFQGASVTTNLGARIIDEPEFHALHDLLGQFEMTLDVVVSTATQTRAVAGVNGVRNRAPAFGPSAAIEMPPMAPTRAPNGYAERPRDEEHHEPGQAPAMPLTPDGEPDFAALAGDDSSPAADPDWGTGPAGALFVRRTLRSGMSIQHDGDVCIIGDVNAGAEIVAGGDVVVWGVLRGQVQAGVGGDTAAVICALLLAPTQLRIAGVVSRGSEPVGLIAPEMARVVHGRILVESWSSRRRGEG